MPNLVDFYFSAEGRVSRKQFWLRMMLPALGMMVFVVAVTPPDPAAQVPAACLALAVFLVPALYVGAKRSHDIGLSGWIQLIGLVPYVGIFALILLLGFMPGNKSANRFGVPPGNG